MSDELDEFKKIEKHLKKYKNYKIGLQNMKKQLDHCFPRITTSYELREGSTGTFSTDSDTEEYAIKRAEKRDDIQAYIDTYGIVISSIDSALQLLDPLERDFVEHRYFNNGNMKMVAAALGCSLRSTYTIREEVKEQFLISLKSLVHIEF